MLKMKRKRLPFSGLFRKSSAKDLIWILESVEGKEWQGELRKYVWKRGN